MLIQSHKLRNKLTNNTQIITSKNTLSYNYTKVSKSIIVPFLSLIIQVKLNKLRQKNQTFIHVLLELHFSVKKKRRECEPHPRIN